MIKPYRYIVFKLYKWGDKGKTSVPITSAVIVLSLVHSCQLMALYAIVEKVFNLPFVTLDKETVSISFILFMLLNYIIFFGRKKWIAYIDEFKGEDRKQKRKGTIWVICYLASSIFILILVLNILYKW